MALLSIRQTTDGFDVEDIISAWYDESSVTLDDVPRFEFKVPNKSGIEAHRLFVGDEVLLRRAGSTAMPGIIEDVVPVQGGGRVTSHTVKGLHTGYALLQAKKLTNYDFDEDGLPATTRDGVTINPHRRFIFRAHNGTLGVDGLPPAVDGVTFENAMRACIGTRLIHQIDFQDNKYILPSQVYATANTIQVYRDGPQSQSRAYLQRVRNGANFKAGTAIDSIPLYGNDKNITTGGEISLVSVLLLGKRDAGSNDVTLSVCRNASAVPGGRTYTSLPLTFTANYNGSGLDAWSGSVNISADGASVKNVLGFRLNIAGGTGTTDTTYLAYAKLTATTVSDSGITEGTIDAYDNPFTLNGAENWVETDLQGDTALEALERLRTETASDPAVNTNPHCDAWIDADLAFHFRERRGAAIAKTYSLEEGNVTLIEHEFIGDKVAYQTIAYGPGSGDAQTRIVSKQAFTAGGFYDADRDWTVNPSTALYGRRARVIDFVDANERSVISLYRKAYAFHKLHRDPIESIKADLVAEHLPYFTVGDSLTVTNLPTRTNSTPRVVRLRRSFSGSSREKLSVTFGQLVQDFADRIHGNSEQSTALTYHIVPQEGSLGLSGNGLYFDKDHYGIYSIPLQDGSSIKSIKLRMGFLPWQATSRAVDISGITIAAGGASVLKKAQTVARAGAVNSTDYGVQSLSGGEVNNRALSGATAAITSGKVAAQNVPAGAVVVYSDSAGTTNVSGSSTDTTSLQDTSAAASVTYTGLEGFVFFYNITNLADSDSWEITPVIFDNNGTRIPMETVYIDNMRNGGQQSGYFFIPTAYLRSLSASPTALSEARVEMKNLDSSTSTFSGDFTVLSIPRHDHDNSNLSGTASGSIVGGLTGNSGSKTLAPGTLLTAADLNAFLGAVQVGYAQASGGTGSLLYTQDSENYYSQHQHSFSGATAEMEFGIYQFGGDSDTTGDLAPLYGANVTFAIDPTIAASSGIPSNAEFSAAQFPATIGHSQTIPGTYEVDVTGYLATDANGIVKSGEHRVFFKGAAGTNNASGLTVLSVTPIIELKQNKV